MLKLVGISKSTKNLFSGLLFDDNNVKYESTIKIKKTLKESFKNMTNGMFWYQYNNRLDLINLFHEAANIATQLQMYWDQAYYESKYSFNFCIISNES